MLGMRVGRLCNRHASGSRHQALAYRDRRQYGLRQPRQYLSAALYHFGKLGCNVSNLLRYAFDLLELCQIVVQSLVRLGDVMEQVLDLISAVQLEERNMSRVRLLCSY